jgi:hypothetical protein
MLTHLDEHAKHTLDVLSVGAMLAALAAWLPPLAALASLIWTLIRIYETKTVQQLLGRYCRRCDACGTKKGEGE